MKRLALYRLMSVGMLSLGLAIAPMTLPAVSQEADAPAGTETVEAFGEEIEFNWGWLGLIGLLGLGGLAGRDRRSTTAGPAIYREPEAPAQTDYRK
ncbi:MAG: hypothetical protein KME20_15060 [Kaiparowitsia implicata GSE-PSE-MK54-09C]|jgi:hypothetical protein|nr:hypothetical protein [Kaiparowitsia implicata GSE-PSE-MK54-09C]